MATIEEGTNATITTSDNGTTGKFGLGGIGNRATEYNLSDNRVEAAAAASYAGELGAYAEIWENVNILNPFPGLGDYAAPARITFSGFWSALIDSIAAGSNVRLTAFVRDYSGPIEEAEIVHKVSKTFDFWTHNENYTLDLLADLETSRSYEVGIRVKAEAAALSTATAHADVHSTDALIQYAGRLRYDSIDVEWL